MCINVVQTASLLYGEQPLMQYTLSVAVNLRLCVNVRIEITVSAVCSECSLNLVAGQVFCRCLFRRFVQRSLLPRYQCNRLHCLCPSYPPIHRGNLNGCET